MVKSYTTAYVEGLESELPDGSNVLFVMVYLYTNILHFISIQLCKYRDGLLLLITYKHEQTEGGFSCFCFRVCSNHD